MSEMKKIVTAVATIPASIGLVLADQPMLWAIVGGYGIYKVLKGMKRDR